MPWVSADTLRCLVGDLTALRVKNAKPGDKLTDGGGLRLDVDRSGNGAWIFRFTSPLTGKERFMGLGSARDVTLAQARDAALAARGLIREGKDPIEQRKSQRQEMRIEAAKAITFKAYAERYITGKEGGWKNSKHRQQWRNSLRDYAYPTIGNQPVGEVDTEAVLSVLRPIWTEKKETARRVRGRIEAILNGAKAEGLRSGENPALWRGHLDQILARRKKSDVRHHPALPYAEMPRFWKSLTSDPSDAAGMLRWIILTACRFNEARDMDEVAEIRGDLWTIPGIRMKGERPHIVPLTEAAMSCLPVPRVSDVSLAACIGRHTKSDATTHGFRSTFRDWAGDETDASWETAEAALAHVVGDETETAYRRGTAIKKRRELMEAWAAYCLGKPDAKG